MKISAEKQYELLTKYRMSIFAISLIWIFFRHGIFYNHFSYGVLHPLFEIGDIGVDIFMFLSGFGLFFSMRKNSDIKHFYKRRLFRILPSIIILLVLFALCDGLAEDLPFSYVISIWFYFMQVYSCNWFIGAILLFYLMYPIIFNVVNKYDCRIIVPVLFIIALGGIIFVKLLNIGLLSQLVVYFARIPIFVLGSLFAKNMNWFNKWRLLTIIAVCSVPFLYGFVPKDIQRVMYCFLTLGLIVHLPYWLDKVPMKINKMISYLGVVSLEFYLIHIFAFRHNALYRVKEIVQSEYLSSIILMVVVILLAFLFNKIINKLLQVIQ